MAGKPYQNTVTISFTLPRVLNDAIKTRARLEMTNASDLIRRALMNYISPQEKSAVIASVGGRGNYVTASGDIKNNRSVSVKKLSVKKK
jgi:hypothetical protein